MSSFDTTVETIIANTRLNRNVMLMGKHGVGKTAAITEACKRMGLTLWYKSAPLMDPDIDFGGIPVPNKKTLTLDFFTQPQLFEAEVIFLDELNRAPSRTLNMIFEIVQFRTINGKPLPKLRAIHTGINPPGEGQYDVQQLDDALLDRFHAFVELKPAFPEAVIRPILGNQTDVLNEWWTKYCTTAYVAPRRLVYVAEAIKAGLPIEHCFTNSAVPVGRLREMLATTSMGETKVVPVEVPIWEEEQFQKALNHPDLQKEHAELAKILKEAGITPEQVWDKVKELRALRAAKAGK